MFKSRPTGPRLVWVAISLSMILAPVTIAISQSNLTVRELMTPDEFAKAGLTKLSATELAMLDQWLVTYTRAVIKVSRTRETDDDPREAPKGTPSVIETCIDGDFNGWDGETIFKLCNGQIWQQAEYDYTYSYGYRPDVVIYKTSEGYRMKVEDEEDTILVKRLK